MAKFFVAISDDEIASQIAHLINNHNRLYRRHNLHTIKTQPADYFVDVVGNTVVGCVGIERYQDQIKIKHVCTHPDHRKKGIAKKLLTRVMANTNASSFFMTIRADNVPSLLMAQSLGFFQESSYWHRDHFVIVMRRHIHGHH